MNSEKTNKFWLKQIGKSSREEEGWRTRAKKVLSIYKGSGGASGSDLDAQFNILWANTEVMRPALYSNTPRPEVRRRFHDKDPVAREVAKILERAVSFSVESYDFDKFGKQIVNDYMLPGRAVARVRYKPYFEIKRERTPLRMEEASGGEIDGVEYDVRDGKAYRVTEVEEVAYEEVVCERWPWEWFRMEPADCWSNVNWVAFGAKYTKSEIRRQWGADAAQSVSYEKNEDDRDSHQDPKAIVWEVWDKRTRKQYFVAEGPEKVLEENEDPLEIEGFFPCPEPIYAVEINDDMVPIPEYTLYQDQARELDVLTARIVRLTEAMKARGAYAGSETDTLSRIFSSNENELIPVDDWASIAEKGRLDNMISWLPIEQFAKVSRELQIRRQELIQQIFELTGVSDIMRGATDPRETARAQSIKTQMGNRRLTSKQQDVQRFFRDIYRIKAEIIANHFSPQTLTIMTGTQIDEQIQGLLQDDVLRTYRIGVETDSTIAVDVLARKEELADAMEVLGGFINTMGAVVQIDPAMRAPMMEAMRSYLASFRLGNKIEEELDKAQQQPPQGQKDPAAEAQAQAIQQQAQIEQQKFQMEMQAAQAEEQRKQEEHQLKLQSMMADLERKREESEVKQSTARAKAAADVDYKETQADIAEEKAEVEKEVKRANAQAASEDRG